MNRQILSDWYVEGLISKYTSKDFMNKPFQALFLWDVPDRLRDYIEKGLRGVEDVELVYPSPISDEILFKHASTANIMIGWRPPEGLLKNAPKLKLFINPGAGVQHHIERFRKLNKNRDITLVNGHGNSYFTAQHAVALLLTLMNKTIPHHNWMVNGRWRTGDEDAKSTPLRRRKVGLLGYGAVNSKVHKFLSGFNVEFLILKRTWENEDKDLPTKFQKFTPSQLHRFLEHVDTLVVAVPQTSATIDLIGKKELELLGSDGLLVNMSRGIVVNQKDLFESLRDGIIAGAAIDVWYNYKPDPDNEGKKYPYNYPFHELDNIVLSPHRGYSPYDDLERWNEVVENIKRYVSGRTDFINVVRLEQEY